MAWKEGEDTSVITMRHRSPQIRSSTFQLTRRSCATIIIADSSQTEEGKKVWPVRSKTVLSVGSDTKTTHSKTHVSLRDRLLLSRHVRGRGAPESPLLYTHTHTHTPIIRSIIIMIIIGSGSTLPECGPAGVIFAWATAVPIKFERQTIFDYA